MTTHAQEVIDNFLSKESIILKDHETRALISQLQDWLTYIQEELSISNDLSKSDIIVSKIDMNQYNAVLLEREKKGIIVFNA